MRRMPGTAGRSLGRASAYAQPSLTRKKLRRLELAAGAPKGKVAPGLWAANKAMRQAKRDLARQGEVAYCFGRVKAGPPEHIRRVSYPRWVCTFPDPSEKWRRSFESIRPRSAYEQQHGRSQHLEYETPSEEGAFSPALAKAVPRLLLDQRPKVIVPLGKLRRGLFEHLSEFVPQAHRLFADALLLLVQGSRDLIQSLPDLLEVCWRRQVRGPLLAEL